MNETYVKAERVWLTAAAGLSEKWVQERIAEDPSILGLGALVLRDVERRQPRAGRLDLLLEDREAERRYEVELQLGATDETHIIRAVEYWDIERKRYPHLDQCAVLVAEDVTSRFLNVISLFNGAIPFIALQMSALRVGGHLTLVFTKVVDELTRGTEEEDERQPPATRKAWLDASSAESMKILDQIFGLIQQIHPKAEPSYNQQYIGIRQDGLPINYAIVVPLKKFVWLKIRIPRSTELDAKIEAAGFDMSKYDNDNSRYRLRITASDLAERAGAIEELLRLAYQRRTA